MPGARGRGRRGRRQLDVRNTARRSKYSEIRSVSSTVQNTENTYLPSRHRRRRTQPRSTNVSTYCTRLRSRKHFSSCSESDGKTSAHAAFSMLLRARTSCSAPHSWRVCSSAQIHTQQKKEYEGEGIGREDKNPNHKQKTTYYKPCP